MKVLVASYSSPLDENRVRAQVDAFLKVGWKVETLGFGDASFEKVARHHEIPDHFGIRRFQVVRALAHLLLPNKFRFGLLEMYRLKKSYLISQEYDLLVLHDLQLLPLIRTTFSKAKTAKSLKVQVDLHEFHEYIQPDTFFSKVPLFSSRLKGYHTWLLSLLLDEQIDLITVVSPHIGTHYHMNLGTINPVVIRNCAKFADLRTRDVDPNHIKLIHHGKAAPNRGLELLIEAANLFRSEITLTFMLTGDEEYRFQLHNLASKCPNVRFIEPEEMIKVPSKLNEFDAEVIFFPPRTNNLKFMSPNKFFEAIQGRIAVISGPSPELVDLINEIGNGVHTSTWEIQDLINTINGLDEIQLKRFKMNSDRYSKFYSSENETTKIIDSINAIVLDR